jgi:hypothetical protein
LPACNPLDPCSGARLTEMALAADRATSCMERVTYNDHDYSPWCAVVQPRLLIATPKLIGAGYEGRLIDGVPPEEAIAVGTLDANDPGSVASAFASPAARHFQRHCGGVWRFAPEWNLAETDAAALAKRVTVLQQDSGERGPHPGVSRIRSDVPRDGIVTLECCRSQLIHNIAAAEA